jgi:hypothetical protein
VAGGSHAQHQLQLDNLRRELRAVEARNGVMAKQKLRWMEVQAAVAESLRRPPLEVRSPDELRRLREAAKR